MCGVLVDCGGGLMGVVAAVLTLLWWRYNGCQGMGVMSFYYFFTIVLL